LREVDRT